MNASWGLASRAGAAGFERRALACKLAHAKAYGLDGVVGLQRRWRRDPSAIRDSEEAQKISIEIRGTAGAGRGGCENYGVSHTIITEFSAQAARDAP